jgi:hypothetical protein
METQWLLGEDHDGALIRQSEDLRCVEMWTTRRLPFEPVGVLRDARNLLRSVLANLRAGPEEILHGVYTSMHEGFVDTENVLFYNVGATAFSSSCRRGLRFARAFLPSPDSRVARAQFHHHHSYRLKPPVAASDSDQCALRLRFEMSRLSASTKPHAYWWAAKQGQAFNGTQSLAKSRTFDTSVVITGPHAISNCAAILKPLFDGMISALHYDSTVSDASNVCQHVGERLGESSASIAHALRHSELAILGERRVVAPYRRFVKWNPEDELCLTGQLLARCHSESEWVIEATIT